MQNKWEHVSERQLDEVIDHLNTLNDTTPKIKCQGRNGVDPNLIFGLQSKLFLEPSSTLTNGDGTHHDEVETVTLFSGGILEKHPHDHSAGVCTDCKDHGSVDFPHVGKALARDTLARALQTLSKENTWRVKGFVRLIDNGSDAPSVYILNWAFGRYNLSVVRSETANEYLKDEEIVRLTVMGERGEVRRAARKLAESIGANVR